MKLLHKTSRIYFLVSALLLLVTGVLLYFFITRIIEEETREQLLANEKRIAIRLSHHQPTTQLAPVIEIRKLKTKAPESLTVTDTVLFDDIEQEHERFLQVSSIRNIKQESYRIILRQLIEKPIGYISSIGLALGITFLFLLLASTFINRYVFKNIWHPFYDSLAALNTFSLKQQQPLEFEKSEITEFESLNEAILKLTEKSRADFKNLKEFTENASHEMQTPVAVIQTKLEELLQSPGLTELQSSQISTAGIAVQKLTKLNRALVLLTKIENRQFLQKEMVNFNQIIQEQLRQLEDFIREKALRVDLQTLAELNVLSDPFLVETLVSNLLRNAIKYNLAGGFISIKIATDSFTISNSGESLPVAPEQLFHRFSKADKTSDSLGLGLAIVRSICDQNGWEIKYEINTGLHVVKIRFNS